MNTLQARAPNPPKPWGRTSAAWLARQRSASTFGRSAMANLGRFGAPAWPVNGCGATRGSAAEPLLAEDIAQQRESLFRWALLRSGDALLRREFASQAVAVLRQEGETAFTDWLLWAAVLVARRAAEQPPAAAGRTGQGGPRHRLSPELRVLLRLAAAGQLTSVEVLALRQMPLSQARQALSEAQRQRLTTSR